MFSSATTIFLFRSSFSSQATTSALLVAPFSSRSLCSNTFSS
uniref:Uncharacterized protein n=1 Tax=Arundo donax TaxID=35708 RepID=A0A0A8ZFZ7_ARUDO